MEGICRKSPQKFRNLVKNKNTSRFYILQYRFCSSNRQFVNSFI